MSSSSMSNALASKTQFMCQFDDRKALYILTFTLNGTLQHP